ncbi:bactericidal permeability increasing protein, gene 4 precursor [Xenopus tropicalis]|uniref:Bactericidal permeability-increasing protein n=1 Tax=Xenopus tropicalis TaxID=8364 RepID=B0BMR6_XENTR|nr:bactericidal permeability increasing protein, gene 4 precursor [Xenopus tropicalis]AAI58536.1 bpi protein [Xenopus tropicalis]|eukprot:NP_001107736.1 bactericidal/permeability-increasing protein precursor [Xenopus tropicalis]
MDFAYRLTFWFSMTAWVGAADAGNPGFVVRLTQKGLDYALQEGMIVLQQQLSQIQLPDFSGTYDVGFLGKVEYKFTSMAISSVQLPSFQVSPVPDMGLKLSISGAFIQVDGRWDVRYQFIHEDGSFNVKVMGLSISVGLKLGNDESGRPTIAPTDCSCHISNVEVHMSGTIGWLVDLFHNNVESELRQSMEDQICPEVTQSITSKLLPLLQTLPVTAKIDQISAIDYSLTGPPSVMANWVDVSLKGEFFDISHRTAPPFAPPLLSLPPEQDLMVYFAVSEYLFNTAGLVYQSAGALVFNLTDDMIPKESSVHLNTSSFGLLIPSVSKMYPNMLMKLEMSAASAPALNINPGNLTLSPVGNIQAYAILPNSSLAPLFLLQMKMNALAKVAVNSGKIVGSLELGKVEISLVHSDVGLFSVSVISMAVNYYVSATLLPRVNEILKNGFPLPLIDHIQLTDFVIETYEHYLLFGANAHYE